MLKFNEIFFPPPRIKEDLPYPYPDGLHDTTQRVVEDANAGNNQPFVAPLPDNEKPVVSYDTWGPKNFQWNPYRIPLLPVLLGIGLFVGLQTLYSIPFLVKSLLENSNVVNGEVVTEEALVSDITSPALVLGSLAIGWFSLLFAAWFAARKYPGGWKEMILWRTSWKTDILIGFTFMLVVRTVETATGALLKSQGVNQEELSNSQILSQFTGITMVLVALGAAIVAPVVEEIFFRGYFMRGVVDKVWVANTTNSGAGGKKNSNTIVAVTLGSVVAIFTGLLFSFALTGFFDVKLFSENDLGVSFLAYSLAVGVGVGTALAYMKVKSSRTRASLAGIVFSSALFGVLHVQATGAASFYTILVTTLIGASLAFIFLVTGRLGSAIMGHLFLNSSAVVLLTLTNAS